jgi:hypothetical protein
LASEGVNKNRRHLASSPPVYARPEIRMLASQRKASACTKAAAYKDFGITLENILDGRGGSDRSCRVEHVEWPVNALISVGKRRDMLILPLCSTLIALKRC